MFTGKAAKQFPPAFGNLPRSEFCLAQNLGPVGNQDTMGGARNRVFGDADLRREEPRNEIAPVTGNGDDAAAIACRIVSSIHASSRQTAAGLPEKTAEVKAST